MIKKYSLLVGLIITQLMLAACQPQTTSEKIENKVEDAAHETKQGVERAGDRVKDATN